MKLRPCLVGVTLLVAVFGGQIGSRQVSTAQAGPVPSGLPTHLAIGLSGDPDTNGIDGWMPNSGIPWDYAYTYLAGGVNTGNGWETWNTNAEYPLLYAQDAASHHYIPVFPYYDLLQSNGTCSSCGEAQKDLSNLNNSSLMASYFQNFRLLMQRLGPGTYNGITGFGRTAIVHVEPDLSGYAEDAVLNTASSCYGYCTAQGNNPADLRASVAGSGDPDVQGLPNTYQGFNWALLHLRDLYAPNVKLAFHISTWATGQDIGNSSDPSLNASALGQEAGSFAAQSGISGVPAGSSTYDLLFNDVLDRDAGYYQHVLGDSSVWWDRQNVTVPNFHRWESYVSAASAAAGRSVIVWQIPIGNQYFDTENNTNGHYQDNRAEYFFGHIGELAQSGIIGLLFGAGNSGSTVPYDGMNDGITNPPSVCTTSGTGSGQICTTHTSTVSDDDGGYIRMEAQQYYAQGAYPLGGTGSPTPTSTPTPTPTRTGTPTSTPTPTKTPPASPTPTSTPTASPTPIKTPSVTPTATAKPSPTVPATATPTATPSPTASPTATPSPTLISPSGFGTIHFDFETGTTQGWSVEWGTNESVANTTSVAYSGTHSLGITLTGTDWPGIYVTSGLSGLASGSKVTYHLYSPSTSSVSIQPYACDSSWTENYAPTTTTLVKGWNTITWQIPAQTGLTCIGFQVNDDTGWTGQLALDAVGW